MLGTPTHAASCAPSAANVFHGSCMPSTWSFSFRGSLCTLDKPCQLLRVESVSQVRKVEGAAQARGCTRLSASKPYEKRRTVRPTGWDKVPMEHASEQPCSVSHPPLFVVLGLKFWGMQNTCATWDARARQSVHVVSLRRHDMYSN